MVTGGTRTGYMCATDFNYELGHAKGGTEVYPSLDNLRINRNCIKECGIVKVTVKVDKIVTRGKI